jgi:phosphoribosyl-ATP pyrophosphohydrolase
MVRSRTGEAIDYAMLARSQDFFEDLGYERVEVPWTVCENAALATSIREKIGRERLRDNTYLPGSAEQSFVDLMWQGPLEDGLYQAVTPCFRFRDGWKGDHQPWFVKNELISVGARRSADDIMEDALAFIASEGLENDAAAHRHADSDDTDDEWDIEINGVEVGSYGSRSTSVGNMLYEWTYGTGLALPRLTMAADAQGTPDGYHVRRIEKGELGEFSKIREEFQEMEDAVEQGNPLMALQEASDLVGAVRMYCERWNLSLDDVLKMTDATERAFRSGRR